jgi:hypothetical protein
MFLINWKNKAFSYFFLITLFAGIFVSQYLYDFQKEKHRIPKTSISPSLARAFDVGLHTALASFLWIDVRTELPFLQDGFQKFSDDLALINNLDPKFSTPYSFSILVLPVTKYEHKIKAAVEIGERGVRNADPDWHIPFYLATVYHLYLKDATNAAKYFDLASRTQGIPDIIRRFAINYGVFPSLREQTKQVWIALYESSENDETKERAKTYVIHFEILDYLDNAVKSYKNIYGFYPENINDLVNKKIIPVMPKDPFGLEFQMYDDGIVGFKKPDGEE